MGWLVGIGMEKESRMVLKSDGWKLGIFDGSGLTDGKLDGWAGWKSRREIGRLGGLSGCDLDI